MLPCGLPLLNIVVSVFSVGLFRTFHCMAPVKKFCCTHDCIFNHVATDDNQVQCFIVAQGKSAGSFCLSES